MSGSKRFDENLKAHKQENVLKMRQVRVVISVLERPWKSQDSRGRTKSQENYERLQTVINISERS